MRKNAYNSTGYGLVTCQRGATQKCTGPNSVRASCMPTRDHAKVHRFVYSQKCGTLPAATPERHLLYEAILNAQRRAEEPQFSAHYGT
eukprot:5531068-Pleurochrysis_carterae.AAC.1